MALRLLASRQRVRVFARTPEKAAAPAREAQIESPFAALAAQAFRELCASHPDAINESVALEVARMRGRASSRECTPGTVR